MKSNLSYILPVGEASRILGEPVVRRIVLGVICLRNRSAQQRQQNMQQQVTDQSSVEEEECETLLKALFYEEFDGSSESPGSGSARSLNDGDNLSGIGSNLRQPPSPIILHAWKLLISKRSLALDKATLFKFLIPASYQPHSGAQGHMGLFECFSYALQGHPLTSNSSQSSSSAGSTSSSYYGGTSGASGGGGGFTAKPSLTGPALVTIPDIIIFLAVCQQYANRSNIEEDIPKQKSIAKMALMSFRIYDSYQKKGIITRDTIQRFLTDVFVGEQALKNPSISQLLDEIFTATTSSSRSLNDVLNNTNDDTIEPTKSLQTALSEVQFCKHLLKLSSTAQPQARKKDEHEDNGSLHHRQYHHEILLDWIAQLGLSMMPLAEIPPSTLAYLNTIENSFRPICSIYKLAEHRLYEIKRRFHSLVHSSLNVLEGDVVEDCSNGSSEKQPLAAQNSPNLPKHVITRSAFIQAVEQPNPEMGHGGYLPALLARWVFQAGCSHPHDRTFWGLYDVLKFGCEAVRYTDPDINTINPDLPLLKFIFSIFAQNHNNQNGIDSAAIYNHSYIITTNESNESEFSMQHKRQLNRSQIGQMLRRLLEHSEFRLKVDSSPSLLHDINENEEKDDDGCLEEEKNEEDALVSISTALYLGLLPPNYENQSKQSNKKNNRGKAPLSVLIDYFLEQGESESDEYATLACFYRWHDEEAHTPESQSSQRRLGPLMLELRLIAAVLFGIPPAQASMEVAIIAEIQRRHKNRYPPTDVSRRGPKGTVWYIIDHRWYQSWTSLVRTVSDSQTDGRDSPMNINNYSNSISDVNKNNLLSAKGPRGLGKISNNALMAENGSLALRPDIRWRHDYEILPPLAWSALQAWYDGGPPIHRTVVPYVPSAGASSPHSKAPRIRTENEIELYPFFVDVFMCDATSRGEARPFQQYVPVSRVSPVRVILLQLCKGLDVDPDYGRLWVMGYTEDPLQIGGQQQQLHSETPHDNNCSKDWLLNLDMNIVDQISRRHTKHHHSTHSIKLLLELKDDDTGLWPRVTDGKNWSFRDKALVEATEVGDGIVGLYNMGNTCYLNASVQCLSHTPIFRDYFTTKAYLSDINTTNPLGHQGQLARVSAVLISQLWKRFNQNMPHQPRRVTKPGTHFIVSASNLTPKTFKESLGKFNDHFSGNEQHDAQELLAFLLGGLSEDLNRIVDKPYIEAPDSDGRPDSELADIWWNNHLKREYSIIVALFTGQYKSLLTCRSCKYESARFEPFSFLQLPLPEDDHISAQLILYPQRDGADVLKYSLRVQNDGTLFDVLVALAKILHADENEKFSHSKQQQNDDQSTVEVQSNDKNHHLHDKTETLDEKLKEKLYILRAQNMAVVDMRDGYISKVASNSWALPELQIKDTGDLPTLHVFELDPLPYPDLSNINSNECDVCMDDANDQLLNQVEDGDDEIADESEDENANNNKRNTNDTNNVKKKYSFLALAQRKSELVSRDFLHPLVQRVFGTPLLLRIVDLESYSGRQLYDLVAKRLQNIVPKSAKSFLTGTNQNIFKMKGKSNIETKINSPAGVENMKSNKYKTTIDMADVSAGDVPRYGFRLRISSRDARRCTICPWFDFCVGCRVPDDEMPTTVRCGDSIAVDWHFAVDIATSGFGQRFNQIHNMTLSSQLNNSIPSFRSTKIPGVVVKNHSSLGAGSKKKGYADAITLEDCLDAFAKEEKIPEAYCSRCKDFRVQTKCMSLRRLPPIVIIHLKRFQFTQHMRRKLRDLVVFPLEGLDLSRIIAGDSVGKNEKVTSEHEKSAQFKKEEIQMTDRTEKEDMNGGQEVLSSADATATSDIDASDASQHNSSNKNNSSISSDDGRQHMLYDLYGVVHHQGALSGGHYVASLKSDIDGQWRLFNDSTIYEIHSRDVVDSTAYILFYIRRDVKGANLSEFWDTSEHEGEGLSEEDMDKLINGRSDRCEIS